MNFKSFVFLALTLSIASVFVSESSWAAPESKRDKCIGENVDNHLIAIRNCQQHDGGDYVQYPGQTDAEAEKICLERAQLGFNLVQQGCNAYVS